jgi:2-dehydropantoate 2-reductase
LCAVKSAHTESAAREIAPAIAADALVVSLQNGIRNASVLRAELAGRTVLAGIVSFNVVSSEGAVFHQGTSGPLIIERSSDPRAVELVSALGSSGFAVETPREIEAHQWAKLLMNLGNAVSALSGAPTRTLILSPGYRRTLAALIGEAHQVLRASGVRPARLKGVPASWLIAALSLPTPLVRLVARAQLSVNAEARSSMWQDLSQGRLTEVDYLNGEIVRLADAGKLDAPLNRRIVELVHAAEARGGGSPEMDENVLWSALSEGHCS